MPSPVQVVEHDLNNKQYFPEHVLDVLHILDRPLPRTLAQQSELLPALPPGLHPLYQEALHSEVIVVDEDNSLDLPRRVVSDILGLVLTSVLTARSTRQCPHGRSERQRCWISLLFACRLVILETLEVFSSEDMAFALPRTALTLEQLQFEKFEGTATVILFVRTDRAIRTPSEDNSGTMEIADEKCEWCSSGTVFYAECQIGQVASDVSDGSGNSYSSLHVPFDAYISPGRGRRVDCELPVVCAADENEIQGLVTSVVCQRHVWGMAIPVVGLSLPRNGTHASVVIGWYEANDDDPPDSSPVIHLASHWGMSFSTLPAGVFDVSDPISALRFAQFILDLHPQFSSIKESTRTSETREFCWRLDHGEFDELLFNSDDTSFADHRLQVWLKNQASIYSLVASPPALPDYLPSSSPPMSRRSSKKQSSVTSPQSPDGRLAPPLTDHSSKSSQSSRGTSVQEKSKKSTYGASEFAKRAEQGPDSQCLETWMMDRFSVTILNLKIRTSDSLLHDQINDMVDLYNRETRLEWPSDWNSLESLPTCDNVLTGLRGELFASFETYKKSKKIERMTPDDDAFQSIQGHMSTFLNIVADARQIGSNEKNGVTTECASRSAWDAALKAACCAPKEMLSDTFFVEQNIALAGNKAVKSGQGRAEALRFARAAELIGIYQSAAAAVAWEQLPSAVPTFARAQLNLAADYRAHLDLADNSQPYPLDREHEPWQAIMDGVYCLQYTCSKTAPTIENDLPEAETEMSTLRALFSRFFSTKAPKQSPSKSCTVKVSKAAAKRGTTPSGTEPQKSKHARCFLCSEVQQTLGIQSPSSLKPAEPKASGEQIFVPFIFAEYKRTSLPMRTAFNQIKLYCVTGLEFLASLGVTDWPVWGIATSGSEGVITMGWKSSVSAMPKPEAPGYNPNQLDLTGVNVLFQYNVKQFNLAQPLEAFHFYTCVHRLYKRQGELKEILDTLPVVTRLQADGYVNWMMAAKEKAGSKSPEGAK